jgi:tetratricopeptide (TPR) repeat protein
MKTRTALRFLPTIPLPMLALLGLGASSPLGAQDDPHAACAAPPSYVPAELLERSLPLRPGVGNSHEKVSTSSEEAQAFYDQGLNYLESYVWIEASRSFHQALRLDPGLAMAHLGLSYVHSGLENALAARHSLDQAKALAAGVGERERRRMDIREKQLAAIEDVKDASRFLAYKKTIDEALARDLEDVELWLLRGNAEESNASGRGQRGGASSIAFYERVLALAPEHASAHHYLVHSYETIGRIDKALEHGEVYARLSPAIPHAAHMWAHDLRRVGRVDDAIAQFRRSDELERAYYAAEGIDPALDWHHAHNLDLLASCYEHKGQMRLTEQTLRESAALEPLSAYRAFNMRELPVFLIHRARYAEALEAGRALASVAYPQSRCVGHALAGQALLALGRADEAQQELVAAQAELEQVPQVALGLDPPRSMVEPWVEALRGELLLREGRGEGGRGEEGRTVLNGVVKSLRSAVGPDAWSQGLFRLELMARAAIETGELAEFLGAQMIDHDAAYAGSHYTQALVLRHKGDQAGVARELAAARGYWRDADRDLAELAQIEALEPRPRAGGTTGR